jgi:transcription initiation factor TFIIB
MGVLRTLDDVSTNSDVKPKDVGRSYRMLVSELDLKVPVIDPMKHVAKVANSLNFSERTKRKALAIMTDAQQKSVSVGKDPMGLAASALYLATRYTKEYNTQAEIAKAAGVTEVTVRNRSKDLKIQLHLKPEMQEAA